jgi:hypothetical protein
MGKLRKLSRVGEAKEGLPSIPLFYISIGGSSSSRCSSSMCWPPNSLTVVGFNLCSLGGRAPSSIAPLEIRTYATWRTIAAAQRRAQPTMDRVVPLITIAGRVHHRRLGMRQRVISMTPLGAIIRVILLQPLLNGRRCPSDH